MKRILLLAVLSTMGSSMFAQRVIVEKYTKGMEMDPVGIFYALPRTILDLEMEMVKVVSKKPNDPNMCDKVLGDCQEVLGQKPFKDGVAFKVRNIKVTPRAVPDTDQIYRVNPKSKWNKRKTIGFTFSEWGTIKGSNIEVEDTTVDMILSVVSAASGFMKSNIGERSSDFGNLDEGTKKIYNDKRERIEKLLAARQALVTSSNIDGSKEILEFKMEEVDKLLAVELKDLIGTKENKPFTLKFYIDVKNADFVKKHTLFQVYEQSFGSSGVEVNRDILPDLLLPYPLVRKEDGVGGKTKFLNMDIQFSDGLGNSICLGQGTGDEKTGLPYRIPANVKVMLTYGQASEPNPIYQGTLAIAQLGMVAYLPYNMDSSELAIYEESGGIQSLTVSASPIIGPNSIAEIDSVTQWLKGKSETEKLQERIDVLTLRKQLEDLLNDGLGETGEN